MRQVVAKRVCSLLLLVCALSACQATSEPRIANLPEGEVSQQQVADQMPHFAEYYQAYRPSQQELEAALQLQGKSLVILFGSWCHDSQREIPRLLKLLDVAQVPLASLQLVAVNQQKQDPDGLSRTYQLRFTPTFILLDGQTELGRIVERPELSLGQDLANLVSISLETK
jgi:thioredoxin 1